MIPYKTYPMHEKVQKERHFLLKSEFNLPHAGDCRLSDSPTADTSIEMSEGDIITIKAYKTSVDATLYTYLVCYYPKRFDLSSDSFVEGIKIDCGYETYMSLDFCLLNRVVFEEVTDAIERELRINEILGI